MMGHEIVAEVREVWYLQLILDCSTLGCSMRGEMHVFFLGGL